MRFPEALPLDPSKHFLQNEFWIPKRRIGPETTFRGRFRLGNLFSLFIGEGVGGADVENSVGNLYDLDLIAVVDAISVKNQGM